MVETADRIECSSRSSASARYRGPGRGRPPSAASSETVGEIADRPIVEDGGVIPGKVMEMTLSRDHRILYGADGAEFLAEAKALPQEPIGLAL